jgi:arabinofuranan 3-O-arabinosyltransferase
MESPSPSTSAPLGVVRTSGRRRPWRGRQRSIAEYLAVGVLAFVPMLASQPGLVTDDTKTYLYLDPGRYMRQAVSLWDPNVALGTVTHENIGYLLPMGPFYWVLAELHVPLWIAQRLWLGALLFAAGAGMLYLCRTIGLGGPGRYVATLGFMFTPYVLQYAGRISVILMPWSGLPWMIAFVILALRRGGWKYPALFALVVALVSGINASSVLYVGIGPALWLPYSVLILRDTTWRKAWGVAWRTGLLTALVSLWWAIGLQVEAAYGVNILKYTETLPSTSSSSSPFEVIRGLGYWFFYGASDQTGNWTQNAVAYTQNLWLLGLSFAVPGLAILAAAFVKWRQRAYFALLIVVGMVLAVGPYPYKKPTGVSSLLKAFMSDTTAGLALRSTDRVSPLVLLGLAVLLGAGVTAVARRATKAGLAIGAFAVAAIAGASVPLWNGGTIVNWLTQSAAPPAYVQQAAHSLNGTHPGTRVYALPGNNFAAYRWGDTNDTVYPGLLTRPFVTHEQQTMGSLATADLLEAVDTPLQEGVMDPNTVAPMASLMSAGDVLVQYDQAYERYDAPNPLRLALDFAVTPPGLSNPVSYGTSRTNVSPVAHLDEQILSLPGKWELPAPLVSYTVAEPRPIVRGESLKSPLIVDGNASGIVDASAVGLLAGNPTILYAGTLDTEPRLKREIVRAPANLVVTDTNRKQGYRWNGITYNAGYTETKAEPAKAPDPTDAPLNLFTNAPADAQSTTVFNGISSVTASSYGTGSQYFVDERPAAALDGDTATAWVAANYAIGQWWQVRLTHPQTTNHINLVTQLSAQPRQLITAVSLKFDGKKAFVVNLGPASRSPSGQTITFATRTFRRLRITIVGSHPTKYAVRAGYQNTVGFAEVRIPGVDAHESVSMPQDLLRSVGKSSIADPLTLVMTRLRSSGFPPRGDAEPLLSREFWLPTSRRFTLTGQARLSALGSDDTIHEALGGSGGVTASSSSRLAGDIQSGAFAAIDGNPDTAWEPGFGADAGAGQWVQYAVPQPITFDSLNLKVVADSQHSVPTVITVAADGRSEKVNLPAIAERRADGSVVDVPVDLPTPLTGRTIRVTVDRAGVKNTKNYYSQSPDALPVAIAEVGIPGLAAQPLPADIPASCRNDLLALDGVPVWISLTGTSTAAIARDPLSVSLCGPDSTGLALGPGDHKLESAAGRFVGIDLDQLALSSSAGGTPTPVLANGQLPATSSSESSPATIKTLKETAVSMELQVSGAATSTAPFELVMGQSINAGWQATIDGHNLGAPVLVDGFANGWRVNPAMLNSPQRSGPITVSLVWTPQRRVNIALFVSAAAIVACLFLACFPIARRRRRRGSQVTDVTEDGQTIDDQGPELALPRQSPRRAIPLRSAIGIGVATGLLAAVVAAPLTGAVVAIATAVVLRFPRTRLALGVAAAACIFAAGAFITVHQGIEPTLPNGGWPTGFALASTLVWAGVMLLGADAVAEVVLRRFGQQDPDPADQ